MLFRSVSQSRYKTHRSYILYSVCPKTRIINQKKNNNNNNTDDDKRSGSRDSKKEKRPAETSLLSALAAYRIPTERGGHLEAYLRQEGIPCYPVDGWHDGPDDHHIVTHAARTYATILCFRDACSTATKMGLPHPNLLDIVDVFGRDTPVKLPRCVPEVGIRVHPVRPALYSADMARAYLSDLVEDGMYHAAMMVDIYQHREASEMLSPMAVAIAATRTLSRTCYLVLHDLKELYGSHSFKATVGKGDDGVKISNTEGSWFSIFRGGKRYISFQPDAKSMPYPVHPYPGLS